MMTLWWANKLKAKDDLHIGQRLRIPSVDGVVVTVTATDTLESLAAKYDVTEAKIVELNQLDDPTLVVGQVLVMPDARGAAIATPKPAPKSASKPSSRPHVTTSGRSGGGRRTHPLLGWQLPVAGRRGQQLHQPVLPLRPLGDRHRGRLRVDASSPPRAAG